GCWVRAGCWGLLGAGSGGGGAAVALSGAASTAGVARGTSGGLVTGPLDAFTSAGGVRPMGTAAMSVASRTRTRRVLGAKVLYVGKVLDVELSASGLPMPSVATSLTVAAGVASALANGTLSPLEIVAGVLVRPLAPRLLPAPSAMIPPAPTTAPSRME